MKAIVCVNSTLAGQAAFVSDGAISPIHEWGVVRTAADRMLCHGRDRFGIVLRARLRGLDLRVTAQLAIALLHGHRGVYLVTPPDVFRALPLLKTLFPRARFVTWVWTAADVHSQRSLIAHCDHVFCLTEGAVAALAAVGLGERGSLQLWGTNPAHYATEQLFEPRHDVALLGQTQRDLALAVSAMASGGFSVATTEQVWRAAARCAEGQMPRSELLSTHAPRTHREVIELFQRSRVSWIPLRAGDPQPTGYTNLAESLLAGTPVVIADSSTLPKQVLRLPGVHLYRVGNLASLIGETRRVLAAVAADPGYRSRIQNAAAELLNGRALENSVARLLR